MSVIFQSSFRYYFYTIRYRIVLIWEILRLLPTLTFLLLQKNYIIYFAEKVKTSGNNVEITFLKMFFIHSNKLFVKFQILIFCLNFHGRKYLITLNIRHFIVYYLQKYENYRDKDMTKPLAKSFFIPFIWNIQEIYQGTKYVTKFNLLVPCLNS